MEEDAPPLSGTKRCAADTSQTSTAPPSKISRLLSPGSQFRDAACTIVDGAEHCNICNEKVDLNFQSFDKCSHVVHSWCRETSIGDNPDCPQDACPICFLEVSAVFTKRENSSDAESKDSGQQVGRNLMQNQANARELGMLLAAQGVGKSLVAEPKTAAPQKMPAMPLEFQEQQQHYYREQELRKEQEQHTVSDLAPGDDGLGAPTGDEDTGSAGSVGRGRNVRGREGESGEGLVPPYQRGGVG